MKMKTQDFLALLGHSKESFDNILEAHLSYQVFEIPKGTKKTRTIEAPNVNLKKIQKSLSNILYDKYDKIMPDCVHGFIRSKGHARNAVSNAKCHSAAHNLLNVDLKDFYYQVTSSKIKEIIDEYFSFLENDIKADILKIFSLNERLPLGAPTSAVLSNIAFFQVDLSLQAYALSKNMVYSRYVDDLSFSASHEISDQNLADITMLILSYGFSLNIEKTKWFAAMTPKVITGIYFDTETIKVSFDLKKRILKNLKAYKRIKRVHQSLKFLGGVKDFAQANIKMKALEDAIDGQMLFVKQVEGTDSDFYKDLKKEINKANSAVPDIDFSVYI